MEIRPPLPLPLARLEHARGASYRTEPDLDEWVWAMRLEEELDYDLLSTDAVASRRRRMVGRVRVVALIALVFGIVGVIRVGMDHGLGLALVSAWALPVVVLAVVLSAEKVLLRLCR